MGNNNGRFMDGLLFGALLGGAAVFLLGTKKGNRLLKILTEEGLDSLEELGRTLEEKEVVPKTIKKVERVAQDLRKNIEEKLEPKTNGEIHPSSSPRRFFRRSK